MTPWLDDGDVQLYHGDVVTTLQGLPAGIAQTCCTSPPYWGLRSYLDDEHDDKHAELGLEPSPDLYVERLVGVFREVWRVLRDDGTVWLNLGDSYAATGGHTQTDAEWEAEKAKGWFGDERGRYPTRATRSGRAANTAVAGLKPKDLVGIPWRVAFALQADGWYLRSDIVWAKPNPMPESVVDRPTKSHEYLFLLAKQPRYYMDMDAIREPYEMSSWTASTDAAGDTRRGLEGIRSGQKGEAQANGAADGKLYGASSMMNAYGNGGRNRRSVWTIPTEPFPEAHFATYPQELVRPCILAGSREGDTVLDPFVGSGTTALVARKHGRRCIGVDLSSEYLEIAARRLSQLSLFAEPA